MQCKPSNSLLKYIKHYLLFEVTNSEKTGFRHFANGHCGLVFCFDKENLVSLHSKNSLPSSFVFGQVSEYQDFFLKGNASIVIVLFQPLGLFALTGINSSFFRNRIEEASTVFGKGIIRLQENLCYSSGANEIIGHLDSFFTRKFGQTIYDYNSCISNFISIALNKRGKILVHELCSQIDINERKLQRLFSEQIGISPKKFLNNIRLHYFLSLTKKKGSLTQFGLEAGYYDQAHLVREFKKTIGFNPSRYLTSERLAVNLIQI